MNSFSWTAVALLLFAGNSFAAVDQNKLATIVKDMLDKYDPKCMFSMAVSIPLKNTDQDYDINQVFTTENGNKVKEEILSGGVYKEGRIVAAKFLRKTKTTPEYHAEYRVLQNFNTLDNNNYFDHDLLLFYVFGSPCFHKCTNKEDTQNILEKLKDIKKWKQYAFVFTDVFKSLNPEQSTSEEQRKQALTNLAEESGLGLENIFRCAKSNDQMLCVSCSTDKQVTPSCVSYDAQQAGTSNTQSSNQK
ncbi:hypothetical protein EXN66_Car003778 [Channa argus]|uniref:Uncharacterized protein n=1 Tax=Channa argus TaxID=215402 RepID=A0A6G1PDK4_CHAAH|nr:hypothetical protein EXN66_Car003778 [Channa argus]